MRSLVVRALSHIALLEEAGRTKITSICYDVDEGYVHAAAELVNADADVEVSIWKTPALGSTGGRAEPELISSFTSACLPPGSDVAQVVSMRIMVESRTMVFVMRSGDITTISLDNMTDEVSSSIRGSVESGLLAAAWSPDDSLLVLVTGDEKLILMTSTFDVLSEAPLHAADFGEDAPINVGWGSKQTQFHGSLGKAAAQVPSASLSSMGSSPDDDAQPRISWRGDGAYFVVSTLSPPPEEGLRRRILRVYDRQAALQSTSEPVAGLEHPLAWRPSGNLIASTQRFGFEGGGSGKEGRHDLVFFERNGLRHGEFGIRETDLRSTPQTVDSNRQWGYKVKELSWSSDSNVLALWVETEETDIVQLWTTGNYHWQQEILPPKGSVRFTSVAWHPEKALHLSLTTPTQLTQKIFAWKTHASMSKPPLDSGSVAVVDGTKLLLTPFRMQNVPPPMSSCQLNIGKIDSPMFKDHRTPTHLAFSPQKDVLGVLWGSNRVQVWDLRTRLTFGRGKVMDPVLLWEDQIGRASGEREARQINLSTEDGSQGRRIHIAVLSTKYDADVVDVLTSAEITGGRLTRETDLELPGCNGWLVSSSDGAIIWESADGRLHSVEPDGDITQTSRFPEFCLDSSALVTSDSGKEARFFVGLADSGRLYVTDSTSRQRLIASSLNSFALASDFVIFTTTSHEVHFAPTESLSELLSSAEEVPGIVSWEKRRVERGTRIVTAVPSTMTLVLQMPRGNLETISPRPLVMKAIMEDVERGKYRKAFLAARKHRIDLSTLVNRDETAFLGNISSFVEQVGDPEYLNLFLTSLGSLSPEMVAKLCDSIRSEMESKDLKKYTSSILTSYVVKRPPEYEPALQLLLRLRDDEPDLVEDAVKYIIFLVDTDRLLDTALGMYDFSIFLMIAQHAQKDPREYLPFLRELRSYETDYQRFKIDDHLKRHDKALWNLRLAGWDKFDEAMEYVERHRLYELALSLWKDTDHYASVLDIYGDWLFERREFRQAALAFLEAHRQPKALVAYEKALEWQELFDLAVSSDIPQDELANMAWRVAEGLMSRKRFADAATVLIDYAKDFRQAIIALVEGNLFSEARRIISLHKTPDLLTEIVLPAILESRSQIGEDISEMREQLQKQLHRIRELRVKKIEEPDAFYGVEDTTLHNVDVMTDVSMAPTAFTRYTVAPSTASRTSKRSSRSKRKMERKIGSGRKGTVDEEEYLLNSVTKLVNTFTTSQAEAGALLPHLFQFTPAHKEAGSSLQDDILAFQAELTEAVEEIWRKPVENDEAGGPPEDSWAARIERLEKERTINPIDKVPKPQLSSGDWSLALLRIGKP
ncbi:IkappaB kinase complex, IKAP component [Gloeophyllum trabeum ATCC 11539]|uniref:Elongator complex protein 1 n=1 Tax=Gloeophyllum trabeum (strain ATCC 11539 / FP-39264 / Madison 617) TaxID=670483 RepID=S7RLU1_GLOTA|nr:IkappaB kinase complex, IKAP component [Gloeophyllum trabeum ATCC 11539]EPQ55375.1 IkappaB kinase complex, IKAP component [Gloeophyllum trabeum ATCC 11539]